VPAITHWLNTELHRWREMLTPDGSGGFTQTWLNLDASPSRFKVDQSTAQERVVAAQTGAEHSHNIYTEPDMDVRRNDRLAPAGVDVEALASGEFYYRIVSTTRPSTPRYLKCAAERVEHFSNVLEDSSSS
jgi:hypothetical protein